MMSVPIRSWSFDSRCAVARIFCHALLFAELDFPLVLLKTLYTQREMVVGGDRKGANWMLSGDLAIKTN